jgi:hypothetical protein
VGARGAVRRKGGRLAGAAVGSEVGHQVAEATIAVAELLGDFGYRPALPEDRANGFVGPVQNLSGAEEEVLVGGIVHGAASRKCHPLFAAPRPQGARSGAVAGQGIRGLGGWKCRESRPGTKGKGQLAEAGRHRRGRREHAGGRKKR